MYSSMLQLSLSEYETKIVLFFSLSILFTNSFSEELKNPLTELHLIYPSNYSSQATFSIPSEKNIEKIIKSNCKYKNNPGRDERNRIIVKGKKSYNTITDRLKSSKILNER